METLKHSHININTWDLMGPEVVTSRTSWLWSSFKISGHARVVYFYATYRIFTDLALKRKKDCTVTKSDRINQNKNTQRIRLRFMYRSSETKIQSISFKVWKNELFRNNVFVVNLCYPSHPRKLSVPMTKLVRINLIPWLQRKGKLSPLWHISERTVAWYWYIQVFK